MFHILEPEVAGHLGKNSIVDTSVRPPIATALHYELDGWLGDDLLETLACYIVTERLADALRRQQLSGFELKPVEISTSDQFQELYGNREIPRFVWLDIKGKAGFDDFGIVGNGQLVVSERALSALKTMQLDNCEVSAFG